MRAVVATIIEYHMQPAALRLVGFCARHEGTGVLVGGSGSVQPVLREVPAPPGNCGESPLTHFSTFCVNLRARAGFSAAGCLSCEAWQCPVLLLQGMLGPALLRCEMGEPLSFFGGMDSISNRLQRVKERSS